MSNQGRKAPSYQEYPSDILSAIPFRVMSLPARGLFVTMRYECWVNVRLPSKGEELARILGLSPDVVAELLPQAMAFFEIVDGFIVCPELERYRAYQKERAERQSQGGKLGSALTNSRKASSKSVAAEPSSTPASNPASKSSGKPSSTPASPERVLSRDEMRRDEQSRAEQNQPLRQVLPADDFVRAYEAGEADPALAYRRATEGY